jgi:hypothetical protein
MEDERTSDRRERGIPREELQGRLQDPTGVDISGANDQEMPAGGEGLEGGTAGKFARAFREESATARRRQEPGGEV